jgi:hypothetical protein
MENFSKKIGAISRAPLPRGLIWPGSVNLIGTLRN